MAIPTDESPLEIGQLDTFIHALEAEGFAIAQKMPSNPTTSREDRGKAIYFQNAVLGYAVRDCSFLHISPQVILQPRKLSGLQGIVRAAHAHHIPLTFASGKTGLSGGFATPYVLVDLEYLETLPTPVVYDHGDNSIRVDQSVLVSYLIRYSQLESKGNFMFPSQPSSAFKLPVRVGGLISTNASGITAGKLGPIADWVRAMTVMWPSGEIEAVTPAHPQAFQRAVGGMGQYGVVLNAHIQLAPSPPSEKFVYAVLFGAQVRRVFGQLQKIQDRQLFPLNSEFIMGSNGIPGKFADLARDQLVKWAILLKDTRATVEEFCRLIEAVGDVTVRYLGPDEYQALLDERTGLAIQTKSQDPSQEFIRFPGFEDLLMPPGTIYPVMQAVNAQLRAHGFPDIVVGYGHLNFRKGQGLLLHIRTPVNVSEYADDPKAMRKRIAHLTAEMSYALENRYHIRPKAEHSTGALTFWHHRDSIATFLEYTRRGRMFLSPHLVAFIKACQELNLPPQGPFTEHESIAILERILAAYLSGKWVFECNF